MTVIQKVEQKGVHIVEHSRYTSAIEENTLPASTAVVVASFLVASLAFVAVGGVFFSAFFFLTMLNTIFYSLSVRLLPLGNRWIAH